MSFDGNGNFLRIMNWQDDAAAGIKIKSDRHDQQDNDFASGLSNAITRDGQSQPTNHIPMNGKRLTNLGDPTVDTDAVNKKYVDAIQTFGTKLDLSGADANGRVNFTSSTGVNGLTFTAADLCWVAKVATTTPTVTKNRIVMNNAVDVSGSDVIILNDDGTASFGSLVEARGPSAILRAASSSGNTHVYLTDQNNTVRAIIYTASQSNGGLIFQLGNGQVFNMNTDGHFYLSSSGTALQNNANISGGAGSIWKNFYGGYADAYTAINSQIENRAAAHANAAIQAVVTWTDCAGEVAFSRNGVSPKSQSSGYFFTGVQGTSSGGDGLYFARMPRRYIPNRGYEAAFPF